VRRHDFLRVQNGETLSGIGRSCKSVSQKCPSAAGTDFQRPASEQGMMDCLALLANTITRKKGNEMKTLTAKDAKFGFGQLIDLARSAPVAVPKHGRPVVVVVAVEEFERLKAPDAPAPTSEKTRKARA
jgi:prevent-host-death family protein